MNDNEKIIEKKKNNLSMKEYFKFGLNNIKKQKFRFVLTVFLTVITLSFISISDSVFNYDNVVITRHAKLLANKNETFVQLEKSESHFKDDYSINYKSLTDNDIEQISKKLKNTYKTRMNIYKITNKHIPSGDIMSYKNLSDILRISDDAYLSTNPYTYRWDEVDIVEWNDFNNFFISNITGKIPQESDEILISNHLAMLLMKVGLKPYGEDNYYKPADFEALINSNKYFHFGEVDKVKIVGIINFDLSEFEDIKNISWNEFNLDLEKYSALFDELSYRNGNIYNKIFVTDEFIDHLSLNNPSTLNKEWQNVTTNTGMLIMENTQKGFLNLLREFRQDDSIMAKSTYSIAIDAMRQYTEIPLLSTILLPTTVILTILSIFLISRFVFSKQDKKNLENEIVEKANNGKIVLWNSIPVAFVSTILSGISLMFIFSFLRSIMGGNGITLNPFILSARQFWIVTLSMSGILLISCSMAIFRLKKYYEDIKGTK